MKSFYGFLGATFLVTCGHTAAAIDCLTIDSVDGSSYAGSISISRQHDADIQLGNCTTVVGDLYVDSDYTGILNISTITNITGTLFLESSKLTDISLDNLLYLNQLQIPNYDLLRSLSMSRLLETGNLGISSALPMNVSFPSLVNATGISLSGNFSSVDFTNLVNATINMNDIFFYQQYYSPLNLSFPSLKVSNDIGLYGNITSLSIPLLDTAETLQISSSNAYPLNFSFPSLTRAYLLKVDSIASISLPSLTTVEQLTLSSFSPSTISLPGLLNGTIIDIGGNITDVQLPVLEHSSRLEIYTQLPSLSCTSASAAWKRILAQQKADNIPAPPTSTFVCQVQLTPDQSDAAYMRQWRLGMILGFCLGFGIPLMIVIWFVGRCYWKRRKGGEWSDNNIKMERIKREIARKRNAEVESARKRASDSDWEDLKKRQAKADIARKNGMEEHEDDAPDLGVFKLQERTPLNIQQVTETEEDIDETDAPPSYDWEASGSRYDWERGESSHDGIEYVSREEKRLLKGTRH